LARALFQLHINRGRNNQIGIWPAHYSNCISTAVEATEKGFGPHIISTGHSTAKHRHAAMDCPKQPFAKWKDYTGI